MAKIFPNNEFETQLWKKGITAIAGVDEVGRGCFAGPVVAAAVILPVGFENKYGIDDSKRLSAKKREFLATIIKEIALGYSIAEIAVPIINEIGIANATQKAFTKAIEDLPNAPEHILIDAFPIETYTKRVQTPIIHGDRKSVSIAAASIIAKVYRDALMQQIHTDFAMYDFAKNKGYGTNAHRLAISKYGLSPLHRTSFQLQKYLTVDK